MVIVETALPVRDHVSLEHMMASQKLDRASAPQFVAMLAATLENPFVLEVIWLLLNLGTLVAS